MIIIISALYDSDASLWPKILLVVKSQNTNLSNRDELPKSRTESA